MSLKRTHRLSLLSIEVLKRLESAVKWIGIPILINFDNMWASKFSLPAGVDWVSVTPAFGRYCFKAICETDKYSILLDAVANRNKTLPANKKISVVVVGDAWSTQPDIDYYGKLTLAGGNHMVKIEKLYDTAVKMAAERNIEVKGMITFAYDWFDSRAYTLSSSSPEIKAMWKTKALSIIKNPNIEYK